MNPRAGSHRVGYRRIVCHIILTLAGAVGCDGNIEDDLLPDGLDPDTTNRTDWVGGGQGDFSDSDVLSSADITAATLQETPVTITLTGDSASDNDLTFEIVENPIHGTLGPVDNIGIRTARVTYTPAPGFYGVDGFLFRSTDGETTSELSLVGVVIYPRVVFDLEPVSGPAPLTVTGTAFTITGDPLPPGTYTWAFGEHVESGSMETHAMRSHTFNTPGVYTVTLTLTLAGLTSPISCICNDQGTDGPGDGPIEVTVNPLISGHVRDQDEIGIGAVTLVADNGGPTAVTNADGAYELAVPLDWSGTVRPEHVDYAFDPESKPYENVTSDLPDEDYAGTRLVPTANPQSVVTNEDTPVPITLTGNSPEGGLLTYFIVTWPQHGSLSDAGQPIDPTELPHRLSADQVDYDPHDDYNNDPDHPADSFLFRVDDEVGRSSSDVLVSITVHAVNDPPTFTVPGPQVMIVSTELVVNMTAVSPGPAEEPSSQTVTFSALSDNPSLIPNDSDHLYFSREVLTITPTTDVTGTANITVTALDDGGTARGGDDSTVGSFDVTVASGPTISGTLSLVATEGARPLIGQVSLTFDGVDGEGGQFTDTATTDVNGYYQLVVPEGWAGTIAPPGDCDPAQNDPLRALLLAHDPTGERNRILDNEWAVSAVSEDQEINFEVWTAPIGIPVPCFGIKETHLMYANATYDFGNGPEPYPDAGNGPYTHYVDNTIGSDAGNPYGEHPPGTPRATIPVDLQPGSVVEIHGGPYAVGGNVTSSGTADKPIFVRGLPGAPAVFLATGFRVKAAYLVFENLDLDINNEQGGFDIRPDNSAPAAVHHVTVRHCKVHGWDDTPQSNSAVFGIGTYAGTSDLVNDIVLYDNEIYDNGDSGELGIDIHGINVHRNARNIWVIDNHIHHNAGDSIQVAFYDSAPYLTPQYVYIARNNMHDDGENAVDLKGCLDVIISQNSMHDYVGLGDSDGTAMVFHSDSGGHSENVWVLANEIYDCLDKATSCTSGVDEIYFIGNIIHDITNPANLDNGGGIAFSSWQSERLYVYGNTVYRCDTGLQYDGTSPTAVATIVNNIFANINYSDRSIPSNDTYHVRVDRADYQERCTIENSLFYQSDGAVYISWSQVYDSVVAFQAGEPGKGEGCIEGDPAFDDQDNNDVHLLPNSEARDNGVTPDYVSTFSALYGIDIDTDFDGNPRPFGGAWDMGAYEYTVN